MNQEIKEQLSAAGMNMEGALSRLMNNEMLLERLLIKRSEERRVGKECG